MKFRFLLSFFAAGMLVACSQKTGNSAMVDSVDIGGQWYIENIVFNDSDYVRPQEQVPGSRQYITFEGDMYFVQTNCNTMLGSYSVVGDSICLNDGAMTEMACDNMEVEDAIRRILPHLSRIDMENDTTLRLNSSDPQEYIVLRRAAESR